MKALSIRQPWAWLVVNGFKPMENRTWRSLFRGPLLIHASQTSTRADYDACRIFIDGFANMELPPYQELNYGGIVGLVNMVDCITESESPWFTGDFAFLFDSPKRLSFRSFRGKLGFFTVPEETIAGAVPSPVCAAGSAGGSGFPSLSISHNSDTAR